MFELVTGPIVMAFGTLLVLMGIYGASPWPWQNRRALASAQLGLRRKVHGATASMAAAGRGARELVGRTFAVESRPSQEAVAAADDVIAALLSELLTLREEVAGLRAQIDPPQKAPTTRPRERGQRSSSATKASERRLAGARSA
jgi:hypothetical protein